MKIRHCIRRDRLSLIVVAALALLGLAGCDDDDCAKGEKASLIEQLKALRKELKEISPTYYRNLYGADAIPKPAGDLADRGALGSVNPYAGEQSIVLTSGPPDPFPRVVGIPNLFTGTFKAQTSVTHATFTGMVPGQTAAGLRYDQFEFNNGQGRMLYLGAIPDATIKGFQVYVGNPFDVPTSGLVPFSNTLAIDLQIEQTATKLIYRARPTPDVAAPGGWTEIQNADSPVDPALGKLFIGMANPGNGAKFSFFRIAAEGEALGGEGAAPVTAKLQDTIDSIHAAQAKLSLTPPDLGGALTDVETATTAHDAAVQLLKRGLRDHTMQRGEKAERALRALRTQDKSFETVHAKLAAADAQKAKAINASLKKLALNEQGALLQILGFNVPTPLKVPDTLFAVRVP